jgi:hypothetical protein
VAGEDVANVFKGPISNVEQIGAEIPYGKPWAAWGRRKTVKAAVQRSHLDGESERDTEPRAASSQPNLLRHSALLRIQVSPPPDQDVSGPQLPYLFGMVKNSEPTHKCHDLRHTFTTWLTQCGVDYAVIQTLKGEPLPGSAKYYIHNWNARLRDAVMRLESFTRDVLAGKKVAEVPVLPLASDSESLSMRNVVPRDRIELSTPAFSGLCSTN